MIKIKNGNILDCTEDIITHQVNTKGIFGAGLALQIKNSYPSVCHKYQKICQIEKDDMLMGTVLLLRESLTDKIIANVFAQRNIGNRLMTEYDHLLHGLISLKNKARARGFSVAIPYKIGCGLGGGDWDIVYKIIEKAFEDYDVAIYNFEGELNVR